MFWHFWSSVLQMARESLKAESQALSARRCRGVGSSECWGSWVGTCFSICYRGREPHLPWFSKVGKGGESVLKLDSGGGLMALTSPQHPIPSPQPSAFLVWPIHCLQMVWRPSPDFGGDCAPATGSVYLISSAKWFDWRTQIKSEKLGSSLIK